jgi:manganese oxidase
MQTHHSPRRFNKRRFIRMLTLLALLTLAQSISAQTEPESQIMILPEEQIIVPQPTPITESCVRIITAKVVAFNQPITFNRLGAVNPVGMMFALERDIVAIDSSKGLVAANVRVRPDKRPRPITLRMNVGDCLKIVFRNLLDPSPSDNPSFLGDDQPYTRTASVHVAGLQLVNSIASDGSNVGQNASSLVAPNGSATYTFYGEREGNHLLYSTAATTGGEGDGGSLAQGLFGSVNVEPKNAEWYRSQLTAVDLNYATTGKAADNLHPIINYDAVYPVGHPKAGLPVLKMLLPNNEIIYSDLNALITGPAHSRFPVGTFTKVATEPDREQPFREFTVIYHDEVQAVQAFPEYLDPKLAHTLQSVADKFAINYGIAGVGSEILANRKGVGPMANCTECKYEEFFLSSWTIGDPAQLVDIPANATDATGKLILGLKATKVLYPDDPSNVHHSYIGDHVKMRVVHAGPKEHHIHHLHAHQWLQTPDDDNSTYLDSQALGPGYAFTTEITHGGSGNRNKTVGDSIFHCHFYPHFAEGMWELWRTHDVFESGTVLTAQGRPVLGARALPDGEISGGTPIPAIVPLPTIAMAPMPTAIVPGFPFFSSARAGHRPPHPPLDTTFDGGLSRHIITGGTVFHEETRLSFDKKLITASALFIPEGGTQLELDAMAFHAQRNHLSYKPDGSAATFTLNGLPKQPGAPFADPCIDDAGVAKGTPRFYKGAVIELDLKFNKAGWHYPQSRILTLWQDVAPTLAGTRPPEPFFFRANTNDCVTFHHTVLVPNVYEQDDFQIKTPTDLMGQHIHLVKFDVTSSDGAGNGFNYEDGTFAPDEVKERIIAIRKFNNCVGAESGDVRDGSTTCPKGKFHPFFNVKYAQTTLQRWFADATLNNNNKDRTLRTVFTHDHFGPSTHQQVGLYAGLVTEPLNSTWRNPETGTPLGGSPVDGGPTSWKADIITQNTVDSYREFLLEFADFTLAYQAGFGITSTGKVSPDPDHVINPPVRDDAGLPYLLKRPQFCPNGIDLPPCPEAVSAADTGTMVVNYRNEPIPHRIWNFNGIGPEPGKNDFPKQATGAAGDLANVYRSNITRKDARYNKQPTFYPPLTGGVKPGDPFTPLLRAYENDKVQIRILVGAHEDGHNFTVHGVKWLKEPGTPQDTASVNNSGYRNNQMAGISEHYEFLVPPLPVLSGHSADFLYAPGAGTDDQWNGLWGIIRAYRGTQASTNSSSITASPATTTELLTMGIEADTALVAPAGTNTSDTYLQPLPNNPSGMAPNSAAVAPSTVTTTTTMSAETKSANPMVIDGDTTTTLSVEESAAFNGQGGVPVCPANAPARNFKVTAVTAQMALPGGTLVYNKRTDGSFGRLHDPTAILFVRSSDLDSNRRLKSGVPIEPLVLRARAGECINITLTNQLPKNPADLAGYNTLPFLADHFNNNQIRPSNQVGLHPQLLRFDVRKSNGVNVGFNPVQTIGPNGQINYRWYAGDVKVDTYGNVTGVPIEFGTTNLSSADPIKHAHKGAIGALIIEPLGATWSEDVKSRALATVSSNTSTFREFVTQYQNDVNLRMDGSGGISSTEMSSASIIMDESGYDMTMADQTATDPSVALDPSISAATTNDPLFVNTTLGRNTGQPVKNLGDEDDAEDTGQKGINYRTEPLWKRLQYNPDTPFEETRKKIFTNSLSNTQVGGDPVTPIFTATAGQAIRFRTLQPGGHSRNNTFMLHGHIWEEQPYTNKSTVIGTNPLSEWKGSQYGIGAGSHFDVLLKNGAGGKFGIPGDYLYRSFHSLGFDSGLWGIFRVSQGYVYDPCYCAPGAMCTMIYCQQTLDQ